MMKSRNRIAQAIWVLSPLVIGIVIFEAVAKVGWIPEFLLPAPSQILAALRDDYPGFLRGFLETGGSAFLGLIFSVAIGLGVAVTMTLYPRIRTIFLPYAVFFQTVPIIAIAPILVIWFGYGVPTVVVSAWIVSLFPIIANSVAGFLSTDPVLLQLFRSMGANQNQTLLNLRIPHAMPQILEGIRVASGLSVIGAIVGEFIAGTGLGGIIDASRNQQRLDRVLAAVLLAAGLGVLFFTAVRWIQIKVLGKWHPSELANPLSVEGGTSE